MKIEFKSLTVVVFLILSSQGFSQIYSELGAVKKDTLEYKQLLPILGKKVHDKSC